MQINRFRLLSMTIVKKKQVLFLAFFLFLLPVFSGFSQAKTETIRFEIQVLGLKIGDMTAEKYQTGDTLNYLAKSKVKFWFFGSVDVDIFTHSKYVGGYLVKSESESHTNRGDFASSILWDGKQYLVDAASYKFENKKPVTSKVQWCSTRTFFEELQGDKIFLSEVYGLTTTVEKTGAGQYSTVINGNENQYTYVGGKLQKVVLENPIKNFQYKRVE